MFWIGIAIIIASYLMVEGIKDSKLKDLEINPEYRLKKKIELELKFSKKDADLFRKYSDEAYKKQQLADANGDKKASAQFDEQRNEWWNKAREIEDKIDKFNQILTDGKPLGTSRNAVFRYNFQIDKIFLAPKNFRDFLNPDLQESNPVNLLEGKDLEKALNRIKGLPISVLVEDNPESGSYGEVIAKSRAEDKASEIIANILGRTYIVHTGLGWGKKGMGNLAGKFVYCNLISIEQLAS